MESVINCNDCGKVFKQQWNLVRHARIHAKEKPYSCDFCAKGFSDRSNLKQHLVIHTRDTPFKCTKCEKVFSSRVHFNRHQVVHATHDLKCVVCEKVFDSKKHLTSHARFHTGENRYMCEICGRSYEKPHTLKAHMMFHSDDNPHKCNDCSKSFTSANDLRRHFVSHSDTKPFKCSECERRFSRNTLLQAHKVTHTNGKQFQCLVCSKEFTYKYNLKRHELCHSDHQKTACTDKNSSVEDKLVTNTNFRKSNAKCSRKPNTKLDRLIVKIKEKVSQNIPSESENQRSLIQPFPNSFCKSNRDTERTCLKNESRGFKIGEAKGEDDTCVRRGLETEVIDSSSVRKPEDKRKSQTPSTNDALSMCAIQAVAMEPSGINSNNCIDYSCDRRLAEEVVLIDSDVPIEESIDISTSI